MREACKWGIYICGANFDCLLGRIWPVVVNHKSCPAISHKWLRNCKSLISRPPSSPSLQIAEACFMGGKYHTLTEGPDISLLLVGMVFTRDTPSSSSDHNVLHASCNAQGISGRIIASIAQKIKTSYFFLSCFSENVCCPIMTHVCCASSHIVYRFILIFMVYSENV